MQEKKQYPNSIFERESWQSLNGKWEFGFNKAEKGFRFSENAVRALEIYNKNEYPLTINVPFCIESALSGIGYTGYVNTVWYKRSFNAIKDGRRIFLHIGAADYLSTVLINGVAVGRHTGGYTPFSFDITDYVNEGENEVFILCEDSTKNSLVMRGKQSERKESHGCDYTRTTGIWQSVYIEYVPVSYIKNIKYYPDIYNCSMTLSVELEGKGDFSCEVYYEGRLVGSVEEKGVCADRMFNIPLSEKHLWEVGCGRLYDVVLRFGEDKVKSYFGLRNIRLDGMRFMLNEKSIFQRLVLDQGFYKDGIYTAPCDDDMIKDIELSMSLGFNGARLHQKVFEPRFLYHCDRLGYIVWGEYPNWGLDYSSAKSIPVFIKEWGEVLRRDFNHPAIIGWCPFNETWNYHGRAQYDPLLSTVYDFTKASDSTRPCIDTSGNFHVKTDIYDVHDYSFDPEFFKNNYDRLVSENVLYEHVLNDNPGRQKYAGEPVFISEYGGIKWESDKSVSSWGYGVDVKTPEEFAERYCGLTKAIVDNPKLFGFCYTQLYDIEQEQNGLFTYERKRKFSDEIYRRIEEINRAKAAIE